MKKFIILMLGVLLFIPTLTTPVSALEKSIQQISEDKQIDNNSARIEIEYEGASGQVYYGEDGITIITDEKTVYLETSREVLKLISVGDVNGDGYVDFLTYQNAATFTSQVLVIDGYNGEVLADYNPTYLSYDSSVGTYNENSYILQMIDYGDGKAIIVYDYTIEMIDVTNGEVVWSYVEEDNVWKVVVADDIDDDGYQDIIYAGQNDFIGLISGATGEQISRITPIEPYELVCDWYEEYSDVVYPNIWDVVYDDGDVYAVSDTGQLIYCTIDELGNLVLETTLDIGVMSDVMLANYYSDNWSWENYDLVYMNPGIASSCYKSFKISYSDSQYLIIDCFMRDEDCTSTYSSGYSAAVVIYNKDTNETTIIDNSQYSGITSSNSTVGVYEEQPAILIPVTTSETGIRFMVYSFEGTLLKQSEVTLSVGSAVKLKATYQEDKYIVEVYDGSVAYVSTDLKTVEYAYESISNKLIEVDGDNIYLLRTTNGVNDKITKYASDLETIIWSYELPTSYSNVGFEYVDLSTDYNSDGIKDLALIVNATNSDNERYCSHFYILSGEDGSAILNNKTYVESEYYDSNNKKVTVYLQADSISLIKDVDGDGKKEYNFGGNIVSTKNSKIIGVANGYIEAEGTQLGVGDINGDGISDYVVITNSESRIYLSSISYSYGYASVSYSKSNTYITNDKTLHQETYATVFGDINNDGVSELIFIGENDEGHQTYRVINGKNLTTMYDLCSDGVREYYEEFAVLDMDINGDGYNEIYGYEYWYYFIYDGATGERVYLAEQEEYVTLEDFEDNVNEITGGDDYYPDYIVEFSTLYGTPNFCLISDVNGDGINDLAILKAESNYQTNSEDNYIRIVSGADYSTLGQIDINFISEYSWFVASGSLINVQNSDNYLLYVDSDNKTTLVIDYINEVAIAEYSIIANDGYEIASDNLVISDGNFNIYSLNTDKSFNLNEEIPTTTDNYELTISWTSSQDYSVMTISDNNDVVYKGNDSECSIKLTEGYHEITLSMDDGQGKSYLEIYEITVEEQEKSYVGVIIAAIVSLLLAIFLGIFQKMKVRNAFKKKEG